MHKNSNQTGPRTRRHVAIGLTALVALVLGGCGSDDEESEASSSPTPTLASTTSAASTPPTDEPTADTDAPTAATVKVGMLFDINGRGDQSFNDAAAAGLDRAAAELPIEVTESTPTGDADRAERMKLLVDQGNQLLFGVGFLWTDDLAESAKANPDLSYGAIDFTADTPNVAGLVFAEHEGSFLVGAAAALKSTTGKLGYIGGVEIESIRRFAAGYVAGAKAVNPEIEVEIRFITQPPDFSGFNDPAKAKEIANGMYGQGIDIIYAAAGGSGQGLFQAAKEYSEANDSKVWGIGVDSDQYLTVGEDLQEYVLTSMVKRLDVAVYDTIKAYLDGTFVGGLQEFNLAKDGVAYSTTGGFIDDIVPQLDAFRQDIIDGKITVPQDL